MPLASGGTSDGKVWPYLLLALPHTLHALSGRTDSYPRKEGSMEEMPDMLGLGIYVRHEASQVVLGSGRAGPS